jgi:PAS domain-containing protein
MTVTGPYVTKRIQTENECRQSKVRLAGEPRLNHVGIWEWNLETKEYGWSDEMYRILGLKLHQSPPRTGAYLNCVYPDDKQEVVKALGKALVGKQPYNIDHRIVWPDGTVRFIHGEAEVTFDKAGRPIRMLGTVKDITVMPPA